MAERVTLERSGFRVLKTTSDARHFTIVLPDTTDETINRLRSLMQFRSR